ncbi:MAG: hypothetical protein JXN61_12275 [Sedimentisphaerales bacterium]|nr:hypothetical protein [Sedimentisphaerales bacterium]
MTDQESNQKDAQGTQTPDSQSPSEYRSLAVKTSRSAVVSCAVANFALLGCVVATFTENPPTLLPALAFGLGILAFVLGVVSLHVIAQARGMLTGKGFAAIGIAIPLGLLFFAVLIPGLARVRSVSPRLYCGTHLSGIGKAMLIYAQDYDDLFPLAGGPDSKWGPTPNWQADSAAEAYGLNDGPGQATISANFYLLVKYTEVTPKSFLCKEDKKATEFTLAEYKVRNKELLDLWDFGPDPSSHCSFSYHIPYGPYPLTSSSDPEMAVAADRNPWLDTHAQRARPVTDWSGFDPNGTRDSIRRANAITHRQDGQNVLFVDGHTSFEKNPNCGLNGDNIYTVQNGTDVKKGIRPTRDSQPANKNDSLLVHDPPRENSK